MDEGGLGGEESSSEPRFPHPGREGGAGSESVALEGPFSGEWEGTVHPAGIDHWTPDMSPDTIAGAHIC